jgi:hypothetical protein
MRAVLVALLTLLPATALAERVYTDKAATHDCAKEPEVVINTSGGTFTLSGACTKLVINGADNKLKADSVVKVTVNGSKNAVEVDAVDKIGVTGNENTVTYQRGVSGKPKAAAVGANNKLNQVTR